MQANGRAELTKLKIQYFRNEQEYHAEKMKLIKIEIQIKTMDAARKQMRMQMETKE
jgi:hypothetical protein